MLSDPELSEEPPAVEIKCFEKTLKRLLKLRSRIASSVTGNVLPSVSGNGLPPVSHPQHSISATAHAAPPVFPMPPVPMQPVSLPPPGFFVARKKRSTGGKMTDRQQFW